MMRATAWTVLAFLSLLSAVAHGAQTLSDGPYVLIDKSSDWNAVFIKDGQPLAQKTAIGRKISVPAVASVPAFDITLRELGLPEPAVVPLDEGTPLFVVADTHGEFEIAIALLRAHKIIDESLRWSFGKGHLVVLGDIFDRGAHQTEILWLLFKLEQEARAAGGAVHVVLGNHESMVLLGDDRYLNSKYTQVAKLIGAPHYAALWSEQAYLGRWIRSKHTLMKIGDLLCVHGGVPPEVVDRKLTLDAINTTVRDALQARQSLPASQQALASFIMGSQGPQWYRGYFPPRGPQDAPAATPADVGRILKHYDAEKILVGHTRVPTITPLYDGKVIAVQVYPHRDDLGAPVMEALYIANKRYFKALADGSRVPLD